MGLVRIENVVFIVRGSEMLVMFVVLDYEVRTGNISERNKIIKRRWDG